MAASPLKLALSKINKRLSKLYSGQAIALLLAAVAILSQVFFDTLGLRSGRSDSEILAEIAANTRGADQALNRVSRSLSVEIDGNTFHFQKYETNQGMQIEAYVCQRHAFGVAFLGNRYVSADAVSFSLQLGPEAPSYSPSFPVVLAVQFSTKNGNVGTMVFDFDPVTNEVIDHRAINNSAKDCNDVR